MYLMIEQWGGDPTGAWRIGCTDDRLTDDDYSRYRFVALMSATEAEAVFAENVRRAGAGWVWVKDVERMREMVRLAG